ncbi:hypothetical protein DFH09DRAFT_1097107 [Mycena vulgaris]|nr:hypothetical protein DFH09DRAFT_1097107 [Mycena vulgaris]
MAQGREKRREAGALKSDDTTDPLQGPSRVQTAETAVPSKNPKVEGVRVEAGLVPWACWIWWSVICPGAQGRHKSWERRGALKRVDESEQRAYTHNYGLHQDTGSKRSNWRHPAGTGARKERASGSSSGGTKTGNAAREEDEGAQRSRPTSAGGMEQEGGKDEHSVGGSKLLAVTS